MTASAIRFETWSTAAAADPARMDVALFAGFAAERQGAPLPPHLAAFLRQNFHESEAGLSRTGRLTNRPVTISSLGEFEDLYDGDSRLAAPVVLSGGPLQGALPAAGEPLIAVIDGIIKELAPAGMTSPGALAAHITAAQPGISARLSDANALRLEASPGTRTFSVLANPAYGFPLPQHARAVLMPSVMAQAVRQFFASGGRTAVIVSLGEPLPFSAPRAERRRALIQLFSGGGTPAAPGAQDVLHALSGDLPPPHLEQHELYGLSHAHCLPDVTFLVLPDLCELVCPPPDGRLPESPPASGIGEFAECAPPLARSPDREAARILPPAADEEGMALWAAAIGRIAGLLGQQLRDRLFTGAVPRLHGGVEAAGLQPSAFVQLAEGWARTAACAGAPGALMPPDAILAGHLAASALAQGTWRSAAALPVAGILGLEQNPAASGLQSCRLIQNRRGHEFSADLTTSADRAWRDGPVSRLMAMLLRQARDTGGDIVFEPSNEDLHSRAAQALKSLMQEVYSQGALAGNGEGDSYTVRCDATTMSQDDLDAGRLNADVTFRPAFPVARISVRLPLGGPGFLRSHAS